MITSWIPRPVFSVLPDFLEPGMFKDSTSISRRLVFEHVTNGLGEPLGVEDHNVFESFVLAIVDDLAQIMHKLRKRDDFLSGYSMAFTNFGELLKLDLWLGLGLGEYLVTGSHPARADQLPHLGELRGLPTDFLT